MVTASVPFLLMHYSELTPPLVTGDFHLELLGEWIEELDH